MSHTPPHTGKILLLGSGELGREFVISAKRLGAFVIACDAYDGAPAMQLADAREVFSMLDGEALRSAIETHQPDFVVPEIEAIRTQVLVDVEAAGFNVLKISNKCAWPPKSPAFPASSSRSCHPRARGKARSIMPIAWRRHGIMPWPICAAIERG